MPRFWPDEPDSNNDDGDNYQNNYLNDKMTGGAAAAQKSLTKYTSSSLAWQSGMKDTAYPYEHGPNWGCPRPIVPLTDEQGDDRLGDRQHDRLLLDRHVHPDRPRLGLARAVADRAVHRGHRSRTIRTTPRR